MTDWFDKEDFWKDLYPFLFPARRFELAEEEVDNVLALAGIEKGHVLDLCCGPGRHCTLFAGRGFHVTAVDKSPYLLGIAKERAKEENVDIEFVREDMRSFVRENSFDLVINMFTSFGYFKDKDEDLVVLENICKSLKPGGTCIIQMRGKESMAKRFQYTMSDELEDGSLLVQRHQIVDDWSRIRNEWLLIKGDSVKRFPFENTIYSAVEIKDRLRQTGFSSARVFGSLDGTPYGPETIYLVAVGVK